MLLEFDGTFIVVQISFIAFMAIMYFILLKPIGQVIYRRQKFIKKNEISAKKADDKTLMLQQKYDEKIKISQKKASLLVSGVNELLNAQHNEALSKAQKRANLRIQRVKGKLEAQKASAATELHDETLHFANSITAKILNIEEVQNE